MKNINQILGAVAISTLTGCASPTVALKPVGPCSAGHEVAGTNGHLRVFSIKEAKNEGDDPPWYQHSSCVIYSPQRKRVKYVGNSIGKFDETPATVTLPPGTYVVKTRAEDYLLVDLPVVIKPGRTTEVHLESGWTPPVGPAGTEIVRASSGYAVGWLASESPNQNAPQIQK